MNRPVSEWLKKHGQKPSLSLSRRKTIENSVSEMIVLEVESQMKTKYTEQKMQELALKQRSSQVNYFWLQNLPPTRSTDEILPLSEKLELINLCSKVKASECNFVICEFRSQLTEETDMKELPKLMKDVISNMVLERADTSGVSFLSYSSILPDLLYRAVSTVKTSSRVAPYLPKEKSVRRNSTLPPSSGTSVFVVERAHSCPTLKIKGLGVSVTKHKNIDPL